MSGLGRLGLRIYSAFLILLKIGVAAIIILAVFSFAVQNVSLEYVGDPFVTLNGSDLVINIPVTIKNYGFYSIDNINVKYVIHNKTMELINGTEKIGDVKVNMIRTFDVPIVINLEELYKVEYPDFYHFTHTDILDANISISLLYMHRLVNISVGIHHKFKWIPPIKEVKIYEISDVKMNSTGELFFTIPYLFDTASYLHGDSNLNGKIISKEGVCGNFSTHVKLGVSYRGSITSTIYSGMVRNLITESQDLKVEGSIDMFGFEFPITEKYYWGAPLSGFDYRILSNKTVYYSFTDDAPYPLSLNITKIYYYNGNEIKKEVSHLDVSSGEHVEKYEKLDIYQPIDKIKIIFHDKNTGITYEEVYSL